MLVIGALPGASASEPYPNAPAALVARLDNAVARGKDDVLHVWDDLVFATVAHALFVRASGLEDPREQVLIRTTQSETRRTDKQIASSGGGTATTTLLNKPSLSSLLAVAVENGAIRQTSTATSATLTSTPYSLMSMLQRDEAALDHDFGFLRHIGLSITVPLENETVRPEQFENYAVSIGVGSRKANTPAFRAMWEERLSSAVQDRLDALTGSVSQLFNDATAEDLVEASDSLQDAVNALDDNTPPEEFRRFVLEGLYARIYRPTLDGQWLLSPESVGKVLADAQTLEAAEKAYRDLDAALEEARGKPLLSVRYVNNRPEMEANYSTLELGFQVLTTRSPRYFDLIFDGDVSLFHREVDQRDRVRSYAGSVALETSWDSPFSANSLDKSQLTLSLGVEVNRRQDLDFTQALVMAKSDVPVGTGFVLPIALVYSSRSEAREEGEWRLNLGLGMDFDILQAIASTTGALRGTGEE